jgi:hypothetical protein
VRFEISSSRCSPQGRISNTLPDPSTALSMGVIAAGVFLILNCLKNSCRLFSKIEHILEYRLSLQTLCYDPDIQTTPTLKLDKILSGVVVVARLYLEFSLLKPVVSADAMNRRRSRNSVISMKVRRISYSITQLLLNLIQCSFEVFH